MKISSSVFKNGCVIPSRYTCEGANISPPLAFSEIPSTAVSLVLIMEDPDVPRHLRPDGMFDHWIKFNIPPTTRQIPEAKEPPSCIGGKTTFGTTRYGGPCPPDREHRYFFKLYALDIMLPLQEGATKGDIAKAMEGHIIEQAQLIGRYEKGKGY